MHLADAAKRHRVLQAAAAGGGEGAAREKCPQRCGARRLSGGRPCSDDPLIEWRQVGAETLERQCGCRLRRVECGSAVDERDGGAGDGDGVRADRGEAVFRPKLERLEACRGERTRSRHHNAVELRGPVADEDERDLCEDGDVGRTDRPDRGDDRVHGALEQCQERVRQLRSRPGPAVRESVRADEHGGTHELRLERGAD